MGFGCLAPFRPPIPIPMPSMSPSPSPSSTERLQMLSVRNAPIRHQTSLPFALKAHAHQAVGISELTLRAQTRPHFLLLLPPPPLVNSSANITLCGIGALEAFGVALGMAAAGFGYNALVFVHD
ncbi:hypothetical protein PanWU01x14_158020 [Parasponia andersonii]|uniref:Uncharacterized protein n=1 Tax=Parasponia andersonii TaxID=3476 RepID=A0A2P5CEU9_PARAD|nr:hypothetical protein PanWU01x14_158020 [Parasponia andersonii]